MPVQPALRGGPQTGTGEAQLPYGSLTARADRTAGTAALATASVVGFSRLFRHLIIIENFGGPREHLSI